MITKTAKHLLGKHNNVPASSFDKKQLAIGVKIEREHTDNDEIAEAIAKDHLAEISDYYTRLVKMEQQAKTANDYSDSLYHATNREALDRILNSGRISTLKHVAKRTPDANLSVELSPIPIRTELPASEAVERLRRFKNVDNVFFTRGGVVNNYGDYIIAKKLQNHKQSPLFNSIPNEALTPREVSIKRKAKIFVPDAELQDFVDKYPHLKNRFIPKSEFKAPAYGMSDRLKALYQKLTKTGEAIDFSTLNETQLRKLLKTRNAYFHGSGPLGTALDNSDIDITVPFKRKSDFDKTFERFKSQFPELHEKDYGTVIPDKKVFKGKINGKDIDLSVTYGDRAMAYRNAFFNAKKNLTPEKRQEILSTKRKLKDSWFFPETRYRLYKNRLAKDLGLKQHYF